MVIKAFIRLFRVCLQSYSALNWVEVSSEIRSLEAVRAEERTGRHSRPSDISQVQSQEGDAGRGGAEEERKPT